MKILATGMSGTLGSALLPALVSARHEVTCLLRHPRGDRGPRQIAWEATQPLAPGTVEGFEAVIHLAGESIKGRWTAAKKDAIRRSRIEGTTHLSQALSRASRRPSVMISASAVGYYGDRGDQLLSEESGAGLGFLPELCRDWEAATQAAENAGLRVVKLRTAMVLNGASGALPEMLTPFRLGLGGKIGSGRQWMSWITLDDLVGVILHLLGNAQVRGPVNAAAPNPVTNAEFTAALGQVLHRPTILAIPAFAARLAFGELADQVLLASARVLPLKLQAAGYQFQDAQLGPALARLLK